MLYQPKDPEQGILEYTLVLVLIAIAVIIVLLLLGPAIGNIFANISSPL